MSEAGGPTTGMDARVPEFEIFGSRQLTSWLAGEGASIALTSLGTGRLVLVNVEPDGTLKAFQRIFDRTTGLWADGQTLYLATLYQLWRFENALPAGGRTADGEDRLFVPMTAYTTGDVQMHDIAVSGRGAAQTQDGAAGGDQSVVFVNTLFDCLARPSPTHSFTPIWQPPWLDGLAAADRCHLTGLAMIDGAPAYVTCVGYGGGRSPADGRRQGDWRARLADGGAVIDVRSGRAVATGLSLPRSPRWHQERLWLLCAGTGELGYLDLEAGRFEPVALCPGYPRGLAFVGGCAVVGTSRPRAGRGFEDLPLGERLRARRAEPRCGLSVIDLASGDTVHWARIDGQITEIADVAALPGARRPTLIGLRGDEVRRTLRIGDPAPLLPLRVV